MALAATLCARGLDLTVLGGWTSPVRYTDLTALLLVGLSTIVYPQHLFDSRLCLVLFS